MAFRQQKLHLCICRCQQHAMVPSSAKLHPTIESLNMGHSPTSSCQFPPLLIFLTACVSSISSSSLQFACQASLLLPHTLCVKQELKLQYGANKGKAYTEEEDRFILCQAHQLGYGSWDELKAAIRDHWRFRFDWFFKSRTPQVCLSRQKRKQKTAPCGVNFMRSKVLYWAAQVCCSDHACALRNNHCATVGLLSVTLATAHGPLSSSTLSTQ